MAAARASGRKPPQPRSPAPLSPGRAPIGPAVEPWFMLLSLIIRTLNTPINQIRRITRTPWKSSSSRRPPVPRARRVRAHAVGLLVVAAVVRGGRDDNNWRLASSIIPWKWLLVLTGERKYHTLHSIRIKQDDITQKGGKRKEATQETGSTHSIHR